VSQSPTSAGSETQSAYLEAFNQLALKIRGGQSFSGRERNCFFLNTGANVFANASAAAVLDFPDDGRGSALTDWDGDGDLDVILTNRNAPRLRFVRNDCRGGSWLALRLTGDPAKGTPRDAIGARVTVTLDDGSRLVRSLRAGEGFLSQGSKRLNFGLGKAGAVREVSVRWPGGGVESFSGVEAGRVWNLKQGGEVLPLTVAPVKLEARPLTLPESPETLRLRLSQPLKLPALTFEDFAGVRHSVEELTAQGPVLINLWATWCVPCAEELKAFAALPADLKVLALNVEQLNEEAKATAGEAQAFLDKLGFCGRSGWASAELVATLDRLLREAVYRHQRMPVPASFLIEKGGWLTVIYKGKADAAVIAQDRTRLGVSEEQARQDAVPFPGPWAGRTVFVSHLMAVVAAWRECGSPAEAETILEKFLAENPPVQSDTKRMQQIAEVQFRLGDLVLERADAESALQHFTDAAAAAPAFLPAQVGRLRALAQAGRAQEMEAVAASLASTPAAPDALAVVAEAHQKAGRWAEAVAALREAVQKNPRFVPGLNALARLLAAAPDESVRRGAEAVKLVDFFLQAPGAVENPDFQLTRAMALAETGVRQEAVAAAERSVALARRKGDRAFLQTALPLLESLRAGQPWRLKPAVP